VVVARGARRSAIERAWATSPLKLLEPRNHGDAAWVFVATYGGGLVDGDRITLRAQVGADAGLVLATQASTKVYRSPRGCAQRLVARVEAGALLAALPAPVVCFAGAHYRQDVAIELAPGASLLWLDGLTAGRSARGERWAFGSYASRLAVTRAGAPVVHDGILLDPRHGPLGERMGRFDALATVIALGPRVAALARDLLASGGSPGDPTGGERRSGLRIAASPHDDGAVVRVAGTSSEAVTRAVRRSLARVPEILGDDPFRAPV